MTASAQHDGVDAERTLSPVADPVDQRTLERPAPSLQVRRVGFLGHANQLAVDPGDRRVVPQRLETGHRTLERAGNEQIVGVEEHHEVGVEVPQARCSVPRRARRWQRGGAARSGDRRHETDARPCRHPPARRRRQRRTASAGRSGRTRSAAPRRGTANRGRSERRHLPSGRRARGRSPRPPPAASRSHGFGARHRLLGDDCVMMTSAAGSSALTGS